MQDFWNPIQSLIEKTCAEFDTVWQQRKRIITTQFLVIFILKSGLSKNKQGYSSVLTELWESNEIMALQEKPISASSVCEARQKMPATIFSELSQRILSLREETHPQIEMATRSLKAIFAPLRLPFSHVKFVRSIGL